MKPTHSPSNRPFVRRLAVALCLLGALAVAAPAAAKGGEPRLFVTAGPVRELQSEREALRARLTRLDFILNDALRSARRPELREKLQDARGSISNARRMLGFLPAPAGHGGVAVDRDDGRADDPRVEALYTNKILVVEVSSVRRELAMAERTLAELEDEQRQPGGRVIVNQARGELQASLQILAGLFAPPQAPPPAPPTAHPPTQNQPWPMAERPFQNLLSALAGQAWARDRINVIESAATANWFVVSQVQQLLQRFDFSQHKLQAVRILKARVLDPQNNYLLYNSFPYAADKQELGSILSESVHAAVPAVQLPEPIAMRELERLTERVTSGHSAEIWFQKLESEAPGHWFTVTQASSLSGRFPTPDSRLRALVILKPRLLDPQNWQQFEALFPGQGYKQRLADQFRQ